MLPPFFISNELIMKQCVAIWGWLLLFACGKSVDESSFMEFGAGEKWRLSTQDTVLACTDSLAEVFRKRSAINVPYLGLNKALKNKDYELYIGAMQGIVAEKTYKGFLQNPETEILEKRIVRSGELQLYELLEANDSLYVYKVVYQKNQPSLTLVLHFVSSKREVLFSYYEQKNFISTHLQ